MSTPSSVEGLLGNDPPSLAQPQPPPNTVETRPGVGAVDSGEEGVINGTAAFALETGGGAEEPSPETGRDSSDLVQIDADSGGERFLNNVADFSPGGGGDAEESSPGAGRDSSVLRQMSVLVVVAGLAAVVFDYEHGMAGFYWFRNWVRLVFWKPGLRLLVSKLGSK